MMSDRNRFECDAVLEKRLMGRDALWWGGQNGSDDGNNKRTKCQSTGLFI